jgi:hypothetical protein
VTLSDGRQVATFQIAAVEGVGEAWAIVEPAAAVRQSGVRRGARRAGAPGRAHCGAARGG